MGSSEAGRTLDAEDRREDYDEVRMRTIGYLAGRMVIVVWTPRGGARGDDVLIVANPDACRALARPPAT
jgi:uncharacterized DUF497 family protein